MKLAGVGVVVVSWWGRGSYEDDRVWDILHAADDYGMKVSLYIEPYDDGYVRKSSDHPNIMIGSQSPRTAQSDVMYLINTYGCHRAFHRQQGRPVFLFFAARQYMSGRQHEWKEVWDELHSDPAYNPIVIAHDIKLERRVISGGWDGGHDYSCSAALEREEEWSDLAAQYEAAGKIFYFTVCPGYNKSRLTPGFTDPIIDRGNGEVYERLWQEATKSKQPSSVVIITSFNEWHEGSSIEPAVPMGFKTYEYEGASIKAYRYSDYEGAFGKKGREAAFAYIQASSILADKFLNVTTINSMP